MILARVDWSVGDNIAFRKDDENIKALIGKLIDGWKDVVSVVRCQEASKAYDYLSDVTSGEEAWAGVKCGEFE